MVAARASAFVTILKGPDVQVVHDGVQDANRIVIRDKVTQTGRKKKIVVLIVRFKDYLCHCCSVIVYFLLFRNYKIVIIYQKSNSYSFDYQKNSYFLPVADRTTNRKEDDLKVLRTY